jgi:hypothetical protein
MPHQMVIPDEMWKLAEEKCIESGEGPASYLRNLLIGAIIRMGGNNHTAQRIADEDAAAEREFRPRNAKQPEPRPPEQVYGAKGKGVHQKCYKEMVLDWREKYPGVDVPFASPMPEARLLTVCLKCYEHVRPGEPIMITTMSNWGL